MAEPVWVHLVPVAEAAAAAARPHQESRGCWCGPTFAIDVRSTLGRTDVRVLLHRGMVNAAFDEFIGLRSRKGEFVSLP